MRKGTIKKMVAMLGVSAMCLTTVMPVKAAEIAGYDEADLWVQEDGSITTDFEGKNIVGYVEDEEDYDPAMDTSTRGAVDILGASGAGYGVTVESGHDATLAAEVRAILEQKRLDCGSAPTTTSESGAAEAARRAEEIVTNFSHDGRNEENLECIGMAWGTQANATDIANSFINSVGHFGTILAETDYMDVDCYVVNGVVYTVIINS